MSDALVMALVMALDKVKAEKEAVCRQIEERVKPTPFMGGYKRRLSEGDIFLASMCR